MTFKYTIFYLFTALFLCSALALKAENFTVSGIIKIQESNETVISATVFDTINKMGGLSNSFGFYSLKVPKGKTVLRFSYVGFKTQFIAIDVQKDLRYDVSFVDDTELQEVVVTATRNETGVQGSLMSAISVPIKTISNVPALAGEVDVMKTLQLLPGVQSGSEGSSGLYVRGGGPEENLILLDGIPLYNVNHMFGFFSVFNVDAVKNVTLYKGSFPARFGSRLSSVVDVQQNEGNGNKYHGGLSVSVISAKFNLEGPIVNENTTFNFSARRTYLDILAQPFLTSGSSGGYYFYDINAKITHKFSEVDKVSFSFYQGNDKVYTNIESDDFDQDLDLNWGNRLAILNWYRILSPSLFMTTNIAYTSYQYDFDLAVNVDDVDSLGVKSNRQFGLGMTSEITDQSVNWGLQYLPNNNHDIRFGANYIYHIFKPSVSSVKVQDGNSSASIAFDDDPVYRHEVAVYLEDNWIISPVFKSNFGLREANYKTESTWYSSLEPRVSLRALINPKLSLKASYSFMSQYIHLLSNSSVAMPTDLWVPVTDTVSPMYSNQYAIGAYYKLPKNINVSLEAYYKDMNNITAYKDGSSFMSTTETWEEKVVLGKSWSYGLEFLLQKNIGQWTGWLSYTWSVSQRKFDQKGQMINYGETFYSKYDRRHDFSLTMSYELNKTWSFSGTYIYGSGQRGTLALQNYTLYKAYDTQINAIDGRNNYKMPDYQRMDLSASNTKKTKRGERIWTFSIFNALNHLNPYMVYVSTDEDTDQKSLRQISLFPIIPSVSYTFKF